MYEQLLYTDMKNKTNKQTKKTVHHLINELVSNSSQMKVLPDTSVGVTNYFDSYYKVKIIGTN